MSRNLEKDSIVASAGCTLSSIMVADLMSLEISRHRVAGVTVTGMMDEIVERPCSTEKHAVWNRRCRKVLSIQLCSSQYPTMRF